MPPATSLVSADVIMLKSVFTPRSSSVLAWAVVFGVFETEESLIRFVITRAPEPLAPKRRGPEEPER